MSESDGITQAESGNERERGDLDSGRQLLLAHSGLYVPASESSSDIHQLRCSLCLTAGLQRVLLLKKKKKKEKEIRPLLLLAQLQIKAHSEGDSSAHRSPLGNGRDGRMNAFVDGEIRARQSKRQRKREELNKEQGGGSRH